MAGHSKFANIKHRKGAQDKKRAKIFLLHAKKISIAARTNKDPSQNASLKMLIKKAKKDNMPMDRIKSAIEGSKNSSQLKQLIYEAFLFNNITCIISVLTDNNNRSSSVIKNLLFKFGGKLGNKGSVLFNYNHQGKIIVSQKFGENNFEKMFNQFNIIDYDNLNNKYTILVDVNDFHNLELFISENNGEIIYSNVEYLPKSKLTYSVFDSKTKEKFIKFNEAANALEDIDEIWFNLGNEWINN